MRVNPLSLVLLLVAIAWLCTGAPPSASAPHLTFQQRLEAQRAIERLRYAHQTGAVHPFERAVPDALIEKKVLTYLRQSVALERIWGAPLTREDLQREARRIARDTRAPGRLIELHAALGHDPVLIAECLVRPALVDRLARSYFEGDARIHSGARRTAKEMHERLTAGESVSFMRGVEEAEVEIVRTAHEGEIRAPSGGRDGVIALDPEEFDRFRRELPSRVGDATEVLEETGAYMVRVLSGEQQERLRLRTYRVSKLSWDSWWTEVEASLDENDAAQLADPAFRLSLPAPAQRTASSGSAAASCEPEFWDGRSPGGEEVPAPRVAHAALWTGSMVLIWGGESPYSALGLNTGVRYDPATDTSTPMSTSGAPSTWSGAVWAGTRMMVWGGYDGLGYVGTGALYDPQADTWTAVSSIDAPSPRRFHHMVWTGDRVIVWGGVGPACGPPACGPNGLLVTGASYDPLADSWSPMSSAGAPEINGGHAVWTGSLIIAWGEMFSINAGGRYNPQTDSWSSISLVDAPSPRQFAAAVWTGSRMIVWGGQGSSGLESTGGRYNPANDTWSATNSTNAPSGRVAPTMIWTGSRVIVWGGDGELNTGGRYNPQNNSWSPTSVPAALRGRSGHAAVWTGSRMVVWGGREAGIAVNTALQYDAAADTWSIPPVSTYPTPRYPGHTAVWTGNLMIVWGGIGKNAVYLNEGNRYEPVTDSWTRTALTNAPTGRRGHAAVWTGTRMVIWGGEAGPGPISPRGSRYDPIADSWSAVTDLNAPAPGYIYTAAWTDSFMLLWGYTQGSFGLINTTGGRYEPGADQWLPMSALPGGVGADHVSAWTGSHFVLWGGFIKTVPHPQQTTYLNTGMRYDPQANTWSATSTAGAPSGRAFATAGAVGGRMVVWGGHRCDSMGMNCEVLTSGGVYQSATNSWGPMSEVNSPGNRGTATILEAADQLLVWGGFVSGYQQTGARYAPLSNAWTPTTVVDAPRPRTGASGVFTGETVIVWGGTNGNDYFFMNSGGIYHMPGPLDLVDNDGAGLSECEGDCDDAVASVYPAAPQVCDGVNNDCTDPSWPGVPAAEQDADGDTFNACEECDDASPAVHPGAAQVCDGLNNDCTDPAWPALPAAEQDADGDTFMACADCDDATAGIWQIPGEASDLTLSADGSVISWTPPAQPGGTTVLYDVIRTVNSPASFPSMGVCESADGAGTSAVLMGDPLEGDVFFYLVRPENGCGQGPAGFGSDGTPLTAPDCP